MAQISNHNFGLLIAFLLPGFVAMCGASLHSQTIASWLFGTESFGSVTVGGFLFSTLAALILGLLCSTIRWLVLDTLHHRTGLSPPRRRFQLLQANLDAYRLIEANHYQFYQFYGNSLAAWLLSYGGYRLKNGQFIPLTDGAALAVSVLLFLGSRDTLRKYYERIGAVLAQSSLILSPDSFQHRGTACSAASQEQQLVFRQPRC